MNLRHYAVFANNTVRCSCMNDSIFDLQKRPLFSIIIPTYNSGKTFIDCLSSLACQTLHDFEVIVQDCLSTDDTLLIASNFHRHNHSFAFKVFSEADMGVYDAMNKALHHARGMWIYILGSDDKLFEATTLESVSKYTNDDVDVIYGDVESPFFGGRYPGRLSPYNLFHKNICHQSIFIRSSIFDKFGCFDLDFKVAADWEHNMRWFLDHTIIVVYINQVIANFADCGLSSTTPDLYFDSQKHFLYVYHGRKTLPIHTKFSFVLKRLLFALRRRNVRDIFTALTLFPYILVPPSDLSR